MKDVLHVRASAYLYSQDLIKVVDGTPGGCRANNYCCDVGVCRT